MPYLILLVGPPGSGKSTRAHDLTHNDGDHGASTVHISQDDQGKDGHIKLFRDALALGKDIIIDRMNFNKEQRQRYLAPAKEKGYTTQIEVLHESFQTCFDRMKVRQNHPTIQDEKTARKVLHFFFTKYEKVENNEADLVIRHYPKQFGPPDHCIIVDLDGTLCDINHRLHHVKGEGKKNWKAFFETIKDDKANNWCVKLIDGFKKDDFTIVLCSGRPDDHEKTTRKWLEDNYVQYDHLFMRPRGDFRQDYLVKEQILDFEILTRYKPLLFVDDRKQVVDMWRKRGYTCLQCEEGDF